MDIKGILQSKTLWGVVAMAIPAVSKALGHEIAPTDTAGLVNASQALINDALVWGGLMLATWGRFTAKGPLTVPKV